MDGNISQYMELKYFSVVQSICKCKYNSSHSLKQDSWIYEGQVYVYQRGVLLYYKNYITSILLSARFVKSLQNNGSSNLLKQFVDKVNEMTIVRLPETHC